jgi:hypothetical protein
LLLLTALRLTARLALVAAYSWGKRSGNNRECVLTVKIRQPSHEFTFGVGMSFIPYPLVLTLVV